MRNQGVPPGQRVTRLEVQKWQWNFHDSPSDADHGQLVDRKIFWADQLVSRQD